jgi:hypothetical protein
MQLNKAEMLYDIPFPIVNCNSLRGMNINIAGGRKDNERSEVRND